MSESGEHTILVVDDEAMVLTSIQGLLELETDFKVLPFTSPGEALAHLKESDCQPAAVDMVISDYYMPGMNGIELLNEVKKLDPTITRVILTGYADKENAIRAINEARLFHYLQKPWDNLQLLVTIRNGLERRKLHHKLMELDAGPETADRPAAEAIAATRVILERLLRDYI